MPSGPPASTVAAPAALPISGAGMPPVDLGIPDILQHPAGADRGAASAASGQTPKVPKTQPIVSGPAMAPVVLPGMPPASPAASASSGPPPAPSSSSSAVPSSEAPTAPGLTKAARAAVSQTVAAKVEAIAARGPEYAAIAQLSREVIEEIGRLERSEVSEIRYLEYEVHFAPFVGLALALVTLAALLSSTWLRRLPA